MTKFTLGAAALLLIAPAVEAQFNRTAVSINGSDLNSCAVATPCRTFPVAIAQTNAGGEVIAVDSGGYAPFTVDRAITVIAAPGVYAGITAVSTDGIVVNVAAGANVVLRNLSINGLVAPMSGAITQGIFVLGGSSTSRLYVENVLIQGFSVGINAYWPASIDDTRILNCLTGVNSYNNNDATSVSLNRVTVKGLGVVAGRNGVLIDQNSMSFIRDSVITGHNQGVETVAASTVLLMENTLVYGNLNYGVNAVLGTARISNCTIADNGAAVRIKDAQVESWGNNQLRGNLASVYLEPGFSGTFTTVSSN